MTLCRHCRKPGCRRGRPLCRAQRKLKPNQRKCDCPGYHYPHRTGSPQCVSNPNHAAAMWAQLDQKRTVRR